MDVCMPGMGGVAAIRQLRAQGSKSIIVALTASGLDQGSAGALEAGAQEMLCKPYQEAHLLERIGALLQLRYVYRASPSASRAFATGEREAATPSLEELLRGIPPELMGALREAVLEARPARIELLAQQVAVHSAVAAARITSLARDFAYEPLIEALAERSE
jgi:DNA-binding response OmpR family regulator